MSKKAEALAILEKHFEQWESNPKRMENGYQYESTYAAMMKKVEQEILQISVGHVPKSKNVKKKVHTRFGKIEACKSHILSQTPGCMGISSFAQETMCYVGQHLVFEEAEHLINNLTGAGFNAKQIERVCHHYGGKIESEDLKEIEVNAYQEVPPTEKDKLHYVSMDGSMYLTREEGWKEIKLGRIYRHNDLIPLSKNRTLLANSQYVAHLGGCSDFLSKMEYYVENLKNKVFIADGAAWIWKWVEDNYPDCTQIVDIFHAIEHLWHFAKEYFKKKPEQLQQWTKEQSKVMKEKGIDPVIEALKGLPANKATHGKRLSLIAYYERHQKRMQYHKFLEQGLQIGSGAIESAHKDVLQTRLKLSGQRWTMQGLQQMAQLRVVYKSGQWNRIKEMCQKAA